MFSDIPCSNGLKVDISCPFAGSSSLTCRKIAVINEQAFARNSGAYLFPSLTRINRRTSRPLDSMAATLPSEEGDGTVTGVFSASRTVAAITSYQNQPQIQYKTYIPPLSWFAINVSEKVLSFSRIPCFCPVTSKWASVLTTGASDNETLPSCTRESKF